MSGIGWHLMLRLDDQRVIAPSNAARRGLARAVHDAGAGRGLLAFRGSDTHLHLIVLCDRDAAGRAAQAIACGVTQALSPGTRFDRTLFQAMEHQSHLANAAEYVLGQAARHGFQSDPLHDASLLPDLLGLRVLGPEAVGRFREHLPRLGRGALLPLLGVPRLEPGSDPSLLPDAAAGALALPDLAGRRPETMSARAALVQATVRMGCPRRASDLLGGVDRKTVRSLRDRAVPPGLVQAVCLQVGLREAIAAR